MMTSDWLSMLSIGVTTVAVLAAPLVALWVGGVIAKRAEVRRAQLTLFGTLVGLRHDQGSSDAIRALNLIDVVFVDEPEVRNAWSRYYAFLSDNNLDNPPGWAIRADRRLDLIMAMAAAVKWSGRISTADMLRTYSPRIVEEQMYVSAMERKVRIANMRVELARLGVPDPNPGYSLSEGPAVPPTTPPTAATPKANGATPN